MSSEQSSIFNKFFKKFERSWWLSRWFQNVLTVIFPAAISVLITLSLNNTPRRKLFIFLSVILFLIMVFIFYFFEKLHDYLAAKSSDKDREIDQLQNQITKLNSDLSKRKNDINGCEEAFSSIQATIELSAKNINELKRCLKANKTASQSIWNLDQICVLICKSSFSILSKLYNNDKEFEVSFVSFKKNDAGNCISKMLCCETRKIDPPSICYKERALPKKKTRKSILQKYCFEKLYLADTNAPLILLSEKEVLNNFWFKDNAQKNTCKYKQYIAIPVCCESKKMVGVLQIASFQANLITGTSETVSQTLIALLRPLSYLALLTSKTQDCLDLFMED